MAVKYGELAYKAALRHIEECREALVCAKKGIETPVNPTTAGKFCGCHECIIREALFAAWPYIFWSSNSSETPVPRIPQDLQDELMKSHKDSE